MKTFTILLFAFIALHTENLSLKIWITIALAIYFIYEIYKNDNNNNLKSAVEYLVELLNNYNENFEFAFKEEIEQAKKMEKKQIMNAWLITKPTTFNGWKKEFKQYYNETFKNK